MPDSEAELVVDLRVFADADDCAPLCLLAEAVELADGALDDPFAAPFLPRIVFKSDDKACAFIDDDGWGVDGGVGFCGTEREAKEEGVSEDIFLADLRESAVKSITVLDPVAVSA